jgi:hypothetical protein
MKVTILKDVMISMNRMQDYFEVVPITLWRATDTRHPNRHPMDLIEQEYTLSNGKVRPADITIKDGWVRVSYAPRGLSVWDKPGVPKGKCWDYFRIPAGTTLPQGLAVVRDRKNEVYGATHYSLAPAWDMEIKSFRMLLRQLFMEMKKETA